MNASCRALLVDPGLDGGRSWPGDVLRRVLGNPAPVAEVPAGPAGLQRRLILEAARRRDFDLCVLPFRHRLLAHPSYWWRLLLILSAAGSTLRFLDVDGRLHAPLPLLMRITVIGQPLVSALILVRLPWDAARQVLGRFLFGGDAGADEVVGHGAGKGSGGLVYWLTLVRKSRRYGLFGMAHDMYWGMPLSLHTWPLSLLLLRALGYRLYATCAGLTAAAGLAWVAWRTGHLWATPLIPPILLSPYATYNLYVGSWEMPAWGAGILALAAASAGIPWLTGLLLAAVLLAHPGAALLATAAVTTLVLSTRPPLELAWTGGIAAALTLWWLIPHRRAQAKLGRARMIKEVWVSPFRPSLGVLYQILTYSAFLGIAAWRNGFELRLLLLAIPLPVLLVNQFLKWTFSHYTTSNFMLAVGAFHVMANPDPWVVAAFLAVVFTSPEVILQGCGSSFRFDLTPVRFGEARARILDLLRAVRGSRIALELGSTRAHPGWRVIGPLGYLLADQEVDFMSPGYVEIGDPALFQEYHRHLNGSASREIFESSCRNAGVRYLLTCTPEFRDELRTRGYAERGSVPGLRLFDMPTETGGEVELTLFEIPECGALIEPATPLEARPNRIRFQARAGQAYLLRFSFFRGWRADLNGTRIPIEDAAPGMRVRCDRDGDVVLRYSIWNYW